MFVILTMLVGICPFTVFAETAEVVDEKTCTELTNPNDILNLSIQQYKEKKSNVNSLRTHQNVLTTKSNDSDEIIANQLLKETTYSDGTVEKEYVATNILILDENNNKVGISQIVTSQANGGYAVTSGGKYNIIDFLQAHYTLRFVENGDEIRCDHLKNTLVGSYGTYSVSQIDCSFISRYAFGEGGNENEDHVYIRKPKPNVTYTTNNPKPMFILRQYFSILYVGSIITYSDGSEYELPIDLTQYFPFDN